MEYIFNRFALFVETTMFIDNLITVWWLCGACANIARRGDSVINIFFSEWHIL